MKKLLAVFLSLTLIVQLVVPAWADSTAAAADVTDSALVQTDVSGAEEKTQDAAASALSSGLTAEQLLLEGKVEGKLTRKLLFAAKENGYYTDVEEVISLLRSKMVERQTKVEIPLRVSTLEISEAELEALILGIFTLAADHTGVADEGDYLLWQIGQIGYGAQYSVGGDYYYLDITYSLSYYTTQAQEEQVSNKLAAVIAGFGFTAETDDYTKVKTIYDYICENVVYDYEHLEDTSYTLKHSAYAALENGTSVCQGYALLLYRMLLMAGIDCRIISGYDAESGEAHAWNIVQLDNFYYNVDSTWDATIHQAGGEYQYYLKAPANFTDHVRDEVYTIPEFHQLYPMAAADYNPGGNSAIASGTCGDGVNWVLGTNGILTISGNGAMDEHASYTDAPWYTYREYVLAVVVEVGVSYVSGYAFYNYPCLREVSCAATTIGKCAFAENRALLAVDLLNGVEEVGEKAFYLSDAMIAVSVPPSVKKFDERAFAECPALEAVLITDLAAWCKIEFGSHSNYGQNWYGGNPLEGKADLYLNEVPVTELVIPANITAISEGAFFGANLTSVIMHDGVTEVGSYAFYGCRLTQLQLSKGLERIQPHTFDTSLDLDTLVIPEGVKRIENSAFGKNIDTLDVTALYLPASLEYMGQYNLRAEQIYLADLAAWCGVEIEEDGSPAYYGADFYVNGEKIVDLVIPNDVTEVKAHTFLGSSIRSLTLPDSVVSIGDHAFRWGQGNPSQLSRVSWSKNLQSIGDYAFATCALQEVVLPDSLQVLGKGAFGGNRSLTSIHIGAGLTKLSDSAFSGTAITKLTLPDHVTQLGVGTFSGCDKLTQLDLGTRLTTIPNSAFSGCSALTELVIPDQITAIGTASFAYCEGLKKITVGSGVKVIPTEAFNRCTKLLEIIIGEGVERVEERAFYNCSTLNSVVFLGSVKELGRWVFWDCRNLSKIVFKGDAPQFDNNTLNGMREYNRLTTLYYPCDNATWKEDIFLGYGHQCVQWLPDHTCKNGVCTLCGKPEITLNGSCGTGVYWTLDAEGTLYVYGKGSVDYNVLDIDPKPATSIVIGSGITGIDDYKFSWQYENVESITFTGNAPSMGDKAFHLLNATAYYPVNNPTWTKDVLKDYGGSITWVAACTAHIYENGTCTLCGAKDPDFIPVGLKGDADNSGEVDYLDAMLVLQYHTGIVGDDALNSAVCDVDDSGEVDYLDAMLLLQYHTGVIPEL